MSDNSNESGDPRTVFIPAPGSTPPEQPATPAAPPASSGWGAPPVADPAAPEPEAQAETAFPGATAFPAAVTGDPREVREGDVLNHLYQVRRFIARGGMGQVFEGVNINNEDERVAIKVILPHLARDPNVLAMFRKEARTLTRLSHPALVQYRTLAMEPQLGVFYIVTEYIDGRNMSDVLSSLQPGTEDIAALIRRLAAGLGVAHSLGAIHRDISPDNVMLEGGRLEGAKVIDFGIAKDLDAGSQTIVGDGFAGKLNYVAPEQLGDFGREIGPWTDVYSLGLTILALINRRDVDMGATLVDAVDKRRSGPDLSPVPAELRGVLEAMLKPNPLDRLRSMDAVIDALSGPRAGTQPPLAASGKAAGAAKSASKPVKVRAEGDKGANKGLLIGGGVLAAVAVLGGLGYALSSGGGGEPAGDVAASADVAPAGDPLKLAQGALEGGLSAVGCSWLDVSDLQVQGKDVALAVKGVAGRPVEAQNEIGKLLSAKGLRAASIDFTDVSQISPSDCGPIEAFRQIRTKSAGHLSVPQTAFEMAPNPNQGGALEANAVVNLDLNGVTGDIGIIGLEDNGTMEFAAPYTRQYLEDPNGSFATGVAGKLQIPVPTTHKGWSGIILLNGRGPFDASLLSGTTTSRGSDWPQRFLAAAKAQGWQSEMVWYRTVDDQPN